MRVLLDTTFALRGPTGTGVYLDRLRAALPAAGVEVVPAANERRRPPAGGGAGSVRNLAADRWWTAVELPRRARAAGAQLIHHPLPALSPAAGVPQVVTVHDLAFERLPWGFDPGYRAWAARAHRAAARAADAVVCVSHSTAGDVRARWGVDPGRIVVACHGAGQELAPADAGARRPPPTHFLYVGDDEPRKNLALLLAAHRMYREAVADPLPLVLVGRTRGAGPGVRSEPPADRERLAALHAGAAALVHPALHEGFGLTPMEAMSAGTPVLAARSPGVVEVCGDAARYFDPRDPAALARALAALASDGPARADLAERGRRRAAEFSWARSARAHRDAYTLALR